MGPVRRWLKGFGLVVLSPLPAWAEVCDKEFEDWDGTPATAFDAVLEWASWPMSWPFFALVIAALVFKSRALVGCALVAGLASYVYPYWLDNWAGILEDSRREGCRGPLWLVELTVVSPALLLLRRRS